MDKEKINSSDLLDKVSIKVNQWLNTEKKDREPKDNVYFWLVKFLLMIFLIHIVASLLDGFALAGKELVYVFAKSLRGALSSVWVVSLEIIRDLIILLILVDNLRDFVGSKYYKRLYSKDKKRKKVKETIFKVIDIILKVESVAFLIVFGFFGAVALFGFIYLIIIIIGGTQVVSPLIIFLSIFAICYFAFRHVQYRVFGVKTIVTRHFFIVGFIVLLLGVTFFAYEVKGYEYVNSLPTGFIMDSKEVNVRIEGLEKIVITSDSKLNNIKLYVDENVAKDEILIKTDSYKTSDISYIYKYLEDSMNITITSDLKYDIDYTEDILNLFVSTLKKKTIYNYNLIKYPNINVYINPSNSNRVSIEHK